MKLGFVKSLAFSLSLSLLFAGYNLVSIQQTVEPEAILAISTTTRTVAIVNENTTAYGAIFPRSARGDKNLVDFYHSTPQRQFDYNPQLTRIFFLHVGKAGGSSFYSHFIPNRRERRVLLPCHIQASLENATSYEPCLVAKYRFQLERHVIGHLHLAGGLYKREHMTFLRGNGTNLALFSVRDPVARFVSAFNFHYAAMNAMNRTVGRDFYKCYDTVDSLIRNFIDEKSWDSFRTTNLACAKLGYGFLTGTHRGGVGRHMSFGYQYYAKMGFNSNKAVAVVRTEFQQQDCQRLEANLGGNPQNISIATPPPKLKSAVDPTIRRTACCVMYQDVATFYQIVLLAINLSHDEMIAYLQNTLDQCEVTAAEVDVASSLQDHPVESFSWQIWYDKFCPHIPVPK